jgi:hypothetical protein
MYINEEKYRHMEIIMNRKAQNFKNNIKNNIIMLRYEYLDIFLVYFLGNGYRENILYDQSFKVFWNSRITFAKISTEEKIFFHKMIDTDTIHYIDQYIIEYKSINNLINCKFGSEIFDLLIDSKHLILI